MEHAENSVAAVDHDEHVTTTQTVGRRVCQPLSGPSLDRDLVDEGTPGPHFLTIWRETEAESTAIKRWLARHAAPELMSARVDGSIEFSFYDTRALCGFVLETESGVTAAQTAEATFP